MSFEKDFNTLANAILTDYQNQFPNADTSDGSLLRIKTYCLASALWTLYKHQDWVAEQIFADTATSGNLEHHAWLHGLTRSSGETDASLLSRLLAKLRRPPAGGNQYDYETWAESVTVAAETLDNPSSYMLTNSGMGAFSDTQSVDGNLGTKAWDTDAASSGAFVSVDLGSGQARNYTKVGLYMDGSGNAAQYKVQYSDGAVWTDVETPAVAFTPSDAGWNYKTWDSVGVHRYWRLLLDNTPGAGSDVMELRWYGGAESVASGHCFPVAQGPGTVDVVILGNLGNGFPSDTLIDAVFDYIDGERPADRPSDSLRVLAPTITSQDVTMTVSGDDADIDQIEADIEAYIDGLAPEERLYVSQLHAIAINNGADSATITTPGSDVVPGTYEVLRAGTISVS